MGKSNRKYPSSLQGQIDVLNEVLDVPHFVVNSFHVAEVDHSAPSESRNNQLNA